jgi:hypothetical protein
MLRRLLLGVIAAASMAASASVLVVALAFALYALAQPYLGRVGAAATVAGSAALLIALLAMTIALLAKARRPKPKPNSVGGLAERIFELVRDKPLVAVTAALGAGFMALRNPTYLGSAIRAFLEGRPPPKRR